MSRAPTRRRPRRPSRAPRPGAGGPRLRAVETSRERIVDAAVHLMARYGVEGMGLQLLADHVGLHKSTLFHHFTTKQELALEALRGAVEPLVELARPLQHADPPRVDQVVSLAEALVDHFAGHPGVALFLLRALIGPGDSFYELEFDRDDDPVAELFTILGRALQRGRAAGTLRCGSVRQTIVNLVGLLLFYPALADAVQDDLPFLDPRSPGTLAARKRELAEMLRRSLTP